MKNGKRNIENATRASDMQIVKIFFCCSDRFIAIKALDFIIAQGNMRVEGVLLDETRDCSYVPAYCKKKGIKMFLKSQLDYVNNHYDEGCCDWLFAFTYGFKLSQRTMDIGKQAVNFSTITGMERYSGYVMALYLGEKEWGVTTHFLSAEFDEGDIIFQKRFSINRNIIKTRHDLSVYVAHIKLECIKELTRRILNGEEIKGERQPKGKYYSQKDLEKFKEVGLGDDTNDIDKRIEALWYPPYGGCYILIGKKKVLFSKRNCTKAMRLKVSVYG